MFLSYLILSMAVDPKGTMSYRTEGENFHPLVRDRDFLRGDCGLDGGWGPGAGGLGPKARR